MDFELAPTGETVLTFFSYANATLQELSIPSRSVCRIKRRIKPLELETGIMGGEVPVNGKRKGVTLLFPGGHFAFQGIYIRNTPIETLLSKRGKFNLDHPVKLDERC